MTINIIAAMAKNRVIGRNGQLPWHISKDLKYFQELTSGKNNAVLMGFNTWKSLPTFPEPLPNRGNIIITKNNKHLARGMIYNKPEDIDFNKELFQMFYPNIWICGGESIYNYYIDKPYIDKLYLTKIDSDIKGDTYFPEIPSNFSLIKKSDNYVFSVNALKFAPYSFHIYQNNEYKSYSS
jgi:dihydrofolate reductase